MSDPMTAPRTPRVPARWILAPLTTMLLLACAEPDTGRDTSGGDLGQTAPPPSGSSATPVSDATKTRCALEVDENAYAFFDGNTVDTRAWRQTTNDATNMAYIRCLNRNR